MEKTTAIRFVRKKNPYGDLIKEVTYTDKQIREGMIEKLMGTLEFNAKKPVEVLLKGTACIVYIDGKLADDARAELENLNKEIA